MDIWQWHHSESLAGLIQVTSSGRYIFYAKQSPSKICNLFNSEGTHISTIPTDIQKASVKQSRSGAWWLIDLGSFSIPSPMPSYECLRTFISSKTTNPWCFQFLHIPQSYEPLLQDIRSGSLWVVSDGSYHPTHQFGTAAYILEGTQSRINITGAVITPGASSDQSAYRSELVGILAAVSVVNALASFHQITAKITIHCNCQTGIVKALNLKNKPSLGDASFDLLQAIQHEIKNSPISWQGRYIKGHQAEYSSFEKLDRPSQLNVLVDHMAKEFLNTATILPRHYYITTQEWSLKLDSVPLIHDIDQTLYDLVHTPIVREYWLKKKQIDASTFDSINWTRLGQALAKMPLTRRLFCSKHTTGMCGVGKFQKIWKMKETNACPHCGQFEEATHLWKCNTPEVKEVWQQSLITLQKALKKLEMDPQHITIIIDYLNSWQCDDNLQPLRNAQYTYLLDLQKYCRGAKIL